MDETSYGREYENGIVKNLQKVNFNESKLEAELDEFDSLLKKILGKKWNTDLDSDIDFEVSDDWQGTFHHCGGIYSEKTYCPEYIEALLDVISQLPHSELWTYHTACECDDLWHGEFFVRYPNVYFPKDGNDYIETFVPKGALVERIINPDMTIQLREASTDGDIIAIQRILGSDPSLVTSTDDFDETPLHHAADKGHLDIIRLLIKSGADLEAKNKANDTPLFSACCGSAPLTTVPVLLDAGAEVNFVQDYDETPLSIASLHGNLELILLLIKAGASIDYPSCDEGPLHHAAMADDIDIAKVLVDHGANPSKRSKSGFTPLHRAAYQGSKKVAEYLINLGVDINIHDDRGKTPLSLCEFSADPSIADLLRLNGGKTK